MFTNPKIREQAPLQTDGTNRLTSSLIVKYAHYLDISQSSSSTKHQAARAATRTSVKHH